MNNIEIKNDEKITIIFNHTGCWQGSANVFVNDYEATRYVAKDLGYRVKMNGSISFNNTCYQSSYGADLAKEIRKHYAFAGEIQIFETTY